MMKFIVLFAMTMTVGHFKKSPFFWRETSGSINFLSPKKKRFFCHRTYLSLHTDLRGKKQERRKIS